MARQPERMSYLGKIGEELAVKLLGEHGFIKVRNLNELRNNHPDADLLAFKDRWFLISVKARNKWTNSGAMNSRYKLHSKNRSSEHALITAREYDAEYSWLAIQLDRDTYSAYFGTYAQLLEPGAYGRKLNGNGICMGESHTEQYCKLAIDRPHDYDCRLFSNQPESTGQMSPFSIR